MSQRQCSVEGCHKPARKGGLCWAHVKRRQRSQPLSEPLRKYGSKKTDKLLDAALRYAHATDDEEYKQARRMLLRYAHQSEASRVRIRLQDVVQATARLVISHIEAAGQTSKPNVHQPTDTLKRG